MMMILNLIEDHPGHKTIFFSIRLVEVSVALDLPADQVHAIYLEYWKREVMYGLAALSGWAIAASRVAKTSSNGLGDITLSLSISTFLTVMFSLQVLQIFIIIYYE